MRNLKKGKQKKEKGGGIDKG
jgi:hypothetical protein